MYIVCIASVAARSSNGPFNVFPHVTSSPHLKLMAKQLNDELTEEEDPLGPPALLNKSCEAIREQINALKKAVVSTCSVPRSLL
jgi:hypothetical protein